MFDSIKNLFSSKNEVNYKELISNGATIIDVRTPDEFKGGHIRGSINIPLNNLQNHISKLDKNKPVIACCASGMRSASARSLLLSNGFKDVHNGGGWMSLKNKISKS